MPTDEQRKRERFEKWVAVRFPWLLESAPEFKPNGEYRFAPLRLRFEAWQGAYCSRDAEVQALREALEKIAETERVVEPTDSPGDALVRLVNALDEARDIARAALAGGEKMEDNS